MSDSRMYSHSLNEVLEASAQAIKNCGFKVMKKGTHTIKASSGVTLCSWGENIQIDLVSTNKGVKVIIRSEPKAQLFDFGKSRENIRKLFSEIAKLLG